MTPVTTKSSEDLKLVTKSNYKPYVAMTSDELQIVLGCLLGDGCCIRDKSNSVYFKFQHGMKQEQYGLWLADHLPNLNQTTKTRIQNRSDGTQRIDYASRRHPDLIAIHALLYQDKRKVVTRKYLNLLGPLGIAIWWMDDGYCGINKLRRQRYGTLATCSFSEHEHVLIQRWFRNVYGIDVRIKTYTKADGRHVILLRFNAENLKRLRKLILPYIPACMEYKVDMKYDDSELYNVEFLPVRNNLSPVRNKI